MAYSRQGGLRRGHIDFAGEYVFDNLAVGEWHVQANVTSSGRSSTLQVELAEGVGEVVKDIEFGIGFTLTGIVLDNDQPVAGVMVSVRSPTTSGGSGSTGSDGRFRIENLTAGSYQVMVMAGVGFRQVEPLELTGDHELRIEAETGTISGVVRSIVDGEPLAGATIVLEALAASDDSMVSRPGRLGNRTETDSNGAFRMPRVHQGDWSVVTTKPGYVVTEVIATVASSGSPELEIQLTPTGSVSFILTLQSGASVASAQITTLGPGGHRLNSSTYPVIEGRVRVSTLPPGRSDLVVQAGDGAATRVAVTSPGDQGRVVLPTAGSLHLKVPELEQEPISTVALSGPDGRPFVGVGATSLIPGESFMSAGKLWITGLTPGVWSFTVEHPDGRTWSGSAAVTPGGTTEVSLP